MDRNSKELKKKMKIFQIIQKNFALIGFVPNQQQNTNGKISKIQAFGIFSAIFFTILVGVYFFYGAQGTEEYMYTIFLLIVFFGMAICHISLVIKNDKIFSTIDFCENMLNESEF